MIFFDTGNKGSILFFFIFQLSCHFVIFLCFCPQLFVFFIQPGLCFRKGFLQTGDLTVFFLQLFPALLFYILTAFIP